MSLLCGIQLKALEKSTATVVVRVGGGRALVEPSAMMEAKGRRAEVVEWNGLNPYWVELVGRDSDRYGRITRSRTLAAGQRREMG